MPILRLLRGSPYYPEDVEIMMQAYLEALRLLNVRDRTTSLAESIAQCTILLYSHGETDAHALARAVANEFKSLLN